MHSNYYHDKVMLACINFSCIWGDKRRNLERMKEFTHEAAKIGCNLIVFPELALVGYECEEDIAKTGICKMHRELAETVPGPCTLEMARLASELNVYVLFGMAERDRINKGVYYNSVAVIGPEGVMGSYRKLHLAGPPVATETICFKPGKTVNIWETRYGPIGVLICYDFWYFPELARIMVLRGAKILINSAASTAGPGKELFIVQQTGARATENLVFAASANLAGQGKSKSFYGHSTIAGPNWEQRAYIYAEGSDQEEIVSATLEFGALEKHQKLMPWKKDRQTQVIQEELRQL
jgi:predicted amidohydrolase